MGELYIAGRTGAEVNLERAVGETTCPEARSGDYADSRRRYIVCGIAEKAGEKPDMAVADFPIAVRALCCGDYVDCPVYQADRETLGEEFQQHKKLLEQRRQQRITDRQIASGARVDDRDEL